jgi:hypothetical protein
MKSLILASLMTLGEFALVTWIFRSGRVRRRAATMSRLFLASLPLFIAVHLATPRDLGILPVSLSEPSRAADLAFGLLVYGAAFFGGILQIYNLADRGFSLRILIDLDEVSGGPLSAEEIAERYSEGRGLEWMFTKRLEDLVEQGLVTIEGGVVRNSARGARTAALFDRLRTFLRSDGEAA